MMTWSQLTLLRLITPKNRARHLTQAVAAPGETASEFQSSKPRRRRAAVNGTMFTPFVGVPMHNVLHICVVWSELLALPQIEPCQDGDSGSFKWPRQSHPHTLTPLGRTVSMAYQLGQSYLRAGDLVSAPLLEGPRTAMSLPGEHLFQASALSRSHATGHISCLWQGQNRSAKSVV